MDDLLYQYNRWWEEPFSLSGVYRRERYIGYLRDHVRPGRVVLVTGLRRVGKTTLMRLLVEELISAGIDPRTILYVSADDYLLREHSLLDVVDSFRRLQRLPVDDEVTLLFDEVASKNDFQQQLKTLVDRDKCSVVASSSSASLLKDKGGLLTGRSTTLEVQPLNFAEYLEFRQIRVARRDRQLLDSYFREYVRAGGLPEHAASPDREYLMTLVDNIIQKDITAFHGLRDHQLLRDYFTLLMERSGKQVSINKMANILKLSPDTARRYLSYFEDSYLVHLVPRWGRTNERLLSPRKVYACDLGIKHLFVGDRDWGSYFENHVYLRLRERDTRIYYVYEDGIELDFRTADGLLLEAKYHDSLNEKQQRLFDAHEAAEKIVVDSLEVLSEVSILRET